MLYIYILSKKLKSAIHIQLYQSYSNVIFLYVITLEASSLIITD